MGFYNSSAVVNLRNFIATGTTPVHQTNSLNSAATYAAVFESLISTVTNTKYLFVSFSLYCGLIMIQFAVDMDDEGLQNDNYT